MLRSGRLLGDACGGESHNTTGQPEHSPLSRGLREFTESRRPLPPRRGRVCCSSFAVHSPFNPSPASPKSPRNPKPPTIIQGALRCEAILGSLKETGRMRLDGSKWGDLQRRSRDGEREERGERRERKRERGGLLMVESPICGTCW